MFFEKVSVTTTVAAFLSLAAAGRLPIIPYLKSIFPRQSGGGITAGPCGAGIGSCASGYCCSAAGFCGQGADYCTSPGCQLLYGPACQGNQPPDGGSSTEDVPRPALGGVAVGGAGIFHCSTPGNIAMTFDDGPSAYTSDLLDKLQAHNALATFFIVGNNGERGPINAAGSPWPALIQRMADEGHQIASHTWTHENSSALDESHIVEQIVYNEQALGSILGYFPTYFRPPYSICNAVCQRVLGRLGYHVIYFDLDTSDYLNDDPAKIQNSKNAWDSATQNSDSTTKSFLEIAHDIHFQTVYNLTDYILDSLTKQGYRAVTVGQCLGDPQENWYRQGGQ